MKNYSGYCEWRSRVDRCKARVRALTLRIAGLVEEEVRLRARLAEIEEEKARLGIEVEGCIEDAARR